MREFFGMIKNALILFIITLVAGALLGLVYQVTKDPIAYQDMLAQNKANQSVFSDAITFNDIRWDEGILEDVYDELGVKGVRLQGIKQALDLNGDLLGYVLQIKTKGYGDSIIFTVGITNGGKMNGISIISIAETPGLGMNAEKIIAPQFAGKNTVQFSVVKSGQLSDSGSQIEAISGATITSKAITDGVDVANAYFEKALKKGARQ